MYFNHALGVLAVVVVLAAGVVAGAGAGGGAGAGANAGVLIACVSMSFACVSIRFCLNQDLNKI